MGKLRICRDAESATQAVNDDKNLECHKTYVSC